jgi:hypothetical protein
VPTPGTGITGKQPPPELLTPNQESTPPSPSDQVRRGKQVISMALPELADEAIQSGAGRTGHFSGFAEPAIPDPHAPSIPLWRAPPPFYADFGQILPFAPILPTVLASDKLSWRTRTYLSREYELLYTMAIQARLRVGQAEIPALPTIPGQ